MDHDRTGHAAGDPVSIEVGPMMDDALIALRWRGDGQHGQTHVSFTETDFLRIAEGCIAELRINADTMLMLQQIGLLPASMVGPPRVWKGNIAVTQPI